MEGSRTNIKVQATPNKTVHRTIKNPPSMYLLSSPATEQRVPGECIRARFHYFNHKSGLVSCPVLRKL